MDARSGGSQPLGHLLPEAILVMKEKGIDISREASKGSDVAWVVKEFDLVTTMGCGDDACPAFIGKPMRDWELEDPKGRISRRSGECATRSSSASSRSLRSVAPGDGYCA